MSRIDRDSFGCADLNFEQYSNSVQWLIILLFGSAMVFEIGIGPKFQFDGLDTTNFLLE
jgi:hypothetical protein